MGRTVVWPARGIVLGVTLAFVFGLRLPEAYQYLPFAASLLLFGLPHGAVDHLVPARLSGRRADVRGALGVVALYLALSGLCLALWFASPWAAFALFILITALHWGAGEVYALISFGPVELLGTRRATRALLLLAGGAVPMLVPLLAFPGAYREVAVRATGLFGAGSGPAGVFTLPFRLAVGLGLAAVVGTALLFVARDLRRAASGALVSVVADTALLVAFFVVVPPVLAVGLYFTLWHAARHVARLVLLDGASAASLRAGRPGRAVAAFARDAAPLTVVALGLLLALYLAVPDRAEDPGSLLGLYLVLISALTIPHAVVVTYMDARQGLWRSP